MLTMFEESISTRLKNSCIFMTINFKLIFVRHNFKSYFAATSAKHEDLIMIPK